MSFYREQLESWVSEIDVKADTVFDVGGADKPIDKRVKSWDVNRYEIFDLPEWDLNKHWIDGGDWEDEYKNRADVIFCLEVFEYIYDPFAAIYNLTDLIKQGGILYISFPFIYPIHNPIEMDYLRYTKQGVIKLLGQCRFKIDEMQSRLATEGNDALQSFFSLEGMRRAKEYPAHNEIGYLVRAIKE